MIYNQGIAGREATFETEPRRPTDLTPWLAGLLLVAERDGRVLGWARVSPYSERDAYRGVHECTLYVDRDHRGGGVGRALLSALIEEARSRGSWKLLGKVFPENAASLALFEKSGFRRVGVHERHAQLDGAWRDVVVLERSLA